MSNHLYDPKALGENLNDFEGIIDRARGMAAKKGPIDLVYSGLRIPIEENTTSAQAKILMADAMPFPHHTAADFAVLNSTPFIESRHGAFEAYVDSEGPNITEISVTRKFGKFLEEGQRQGLVLKACWQECFVRAGGELYPGYDMRTPVQEAMRAAWHRGALLHQAMHPGPEQPRGLIL